MLLPETVTSFRSGPGYVRALANGGVEGSMSRNELLAYFSGRDSGHAYTKKAFVNSKARLKYNPGGGIPLMRNGSGGPVIGGFTADIDSHPHPLTETLDYTWTMSDSKLQDYGTDLINATSPVQSMVDLLVTIAETVHEGLPKPLASVITRKGVKNRSAVIQKIGSEYLGYIFGVRPLLSDIRGTIDALNQANRIVGQWITDNQRQVRRRRRLKTIHSPSNTSYTLEGGSSIGYTGLVPAAAPSGFSYYGWALGNSNWRYTRNKLQNITTKITFSSAFEYDLSLLLPDDKVGLLDKGNASDDELKSYLLEYLLGIHTSQIGPELVWNLMPWSWMIDWFTNVGTVLDNLRARTSVGMQIDWAYVKAVQERWCRYTEVVENRTTGAFVASQDWELKQLYVRRLKASPFGFKVSFDGFTSNQIGTLAALAAARLPF